MPYAKKIQIPEQVPLPYSSDKFRNAWNEWMLYRRENGLRTYKPMGLKKTFALLVKQSQGNEQIAIDMIDQAMAYNWQGIYPIKPDYYARTNKSNPGNPGNPGNAFGTSGQRVKKARNW